MSRQRSKGKLFSSSQIPTGPQSGIEDPRSPDFKNNVYSSSSLKFILPIESTQQKGEESRPGRDRSLPPEGVNFLDPRIDSPTRSGKNILFDRDMKQEITGSEKTRSERNMDVCSDVMGTKIGESKRAILIDHEHWIWRWGQGPVQSPFKNQVQGPVQGPVQGSGQRNVHSENSKDENRFENRIENKDENDSKNENVNEWLSGVTELSVRHMSVPSMLSEVTRYSSQLPSLTTLQLVDNNITTLNQVRH